MNRPKQHFCRCGREMFRYRHTCGRCLLANLIQRRKLERDRIRAKRKDPAYRERERLAVSARMRRLRKARREATQHVGHAHV
jgi:hypothetical protein